MKKLDKNNLIIKVAEAPGTALKLFAIYAGLVIASSGIWLSTLAENKTFRMNHPVVEGIIAGSMLVLGGLMLGFVLHRVYQAVNARIVLRKEPYGMSDDEIDGQVAWYFQKQDEHEREIYSQISKGYKT